jgi:hypothetical protein
MAFSLRSLSVLAYAQGFTLWHYRSAADALAVVGQAGFFDPAADLMTQGDMVLMSAPDGGKACFVRSDAGRVVTAPLS